jgi:hypothetical protein
MARFCFFFLNKPKIIDSPANDPSKVRCEEMSDFPPYAIQILIEFCA